MTTSAGRRAGRWVRWCAVAVVLVLFAVELVIGWPSLSSALSQLRAPDPSWLTAAVAAELMAMGAYARMQRSLLLSAGLRVPIYRHVALAYAAHSLSVTLPGGPAFSTRFNYQQMRRFGASPGVASWCIALSGILSATALAVLSTVSVLASHGTPRWSSLGGLAVLIVLATLGVRRIARRTAAVEPVIRGVLAAANRLRRQPADDGVERVRGFVTQLGAARLTLGHGAAAAAFAVINWVVDAGCLWMCFHAVSAGRINAIQVLLSFCAGMAAGTLTIIPGGLGIIDSALILGLVTGGVDTPTAIAAVVLYRLISFCFIIGLGWITWLVIRCRHREVMTTAPPPPAAFLDPREEQRGAE